MEFGGEARRECLVGDIKHYEKPNKNKNNIIAVIKCSLTPLLALSTFVALCGSLSVGYASGFSSPTESEIMQDLGLSAAQYSLFGSMLTIGGLIGAVVNGKVADQFGRRGLLLSCGISLAYFMGIIIRWRTLALIGAIPCVLQAVGLFFVPESPRWMAKFGGENDFEVSLRRLRGKNIDCHQEAAEIRNFTETVEQHSEARVLELFQKRYAHALIVGLGLLCLQQFGGPKTYSYYASSIFEAAGYSSSVGTIAVAIVQVPAAALGVILSDKCGRRPLLMLNVRTYAHIYIYINYICYAVDCKWNVPGLFSCGPVFLFPANPFSKQVHSHFGLPWRIGVQCKLPGRNGRTTMGDSVRDLSHKYKRCSGKCSDSVLLDMRLVISMMKMLKKNIEYLLGLSSRSEDYSPLGGGLGLIIAIAIAANNENGKKVVESARVKPTKSEISTSGDEQKHNINSDDQIHYNCMDGERRIEKRKILKKSFPPPLSSFNLNGQRLYFLRAVRKEGRLELIEVRIHRPEIIHARRDGRLRIHLIPDHHQLITLVEQEQEKQEINNNDIKKLQEEEEWKIMMRGSSSTGEGMSRCHDQVFNHHHHHHHHMQMCGVGIM
ncbi:sugar transporter ERD6-like 5 isoform X2 [Senna tora]|uniref:Sugar transporter ERD6-like 5 isoform X2 n=1 Tax=Senna tora TaxID=362788 RepID=A0A834TBK5_9FABA|nr:sugar transporter ERD6-like 5 isoform X2 [Senna tora]